MPQAPAASGKKMKKTVKKKRKKKSKKRKKGSSKRSSETKMGERVMSLACLGITSPDDGSPPVDFDEFPDSRCLDITLEELPWGVSFGWWEQRMLVIKLDASRPELSDIKIGAALISVNGIALPPERDYAMALLQQSSNSATTLRLRNPAVPVPPPPSLPPHKDVVDETTDDGVVELKSTLAKLEIAVAALKEAGTGGVEELEAQLIVVREQLAAHSGTIPSNTVGGSETLIQTGMMDDAEEKKATRKKSKKKRRTQKKTLAKKKKSKSKHGVGPVELAPSRKLLNSRDGLAHEGDGKTHEGVEIESDGHVLSSPKVDLITHAIESNIHSEFVSVSDTSNYWYHRRRMGSKRTHWSEVSETCE